MGRFINADGIVGANNNLIAYNQFVYCSNNPVIFADDSGYTQRYTMMSDGGVGGSGYGYTPIITGGVNNELGDGWHYRIDPAAPEKKLQRHVHVFKKGDEYSQNDDGSPHDNSTGKPSNKIRQKLKDKSGWDWDKKESEYKKSYYIEKPALPSYEYEIKSAKRNKGAIAIGIAGICIGVGGMVGYPISTGGSSILHRFQCK